MQSFRKSSTFIRIMVFLGLVVGSLACAKKESPIGPDIPITSITVTGKVLGNYMAPFPGITVRIAGHPDAVAGIDGSFAIADVETPYDISLFSGNNASVTAYMGLTTPSPVLSYFGQSPVQGRSATLEVSAPRGFDRTMVVIHGPDLPFASRIDSMDSFPVSWYGPSDTIAVEVHVICYNISQPGLECGAYAHKSIILHSGGTHRTSFESSDFSDPVEGTISGTLVPPGGTPTSVGMTCTMRFQCGDVSVLVDGLMGGVPAFSYTASVIPGISYILRAETSFDRFGRSVTVFRGLVPGTSGLSLSLSSVPTVVAPAENASNVDTTQSLVWTTPGPKGIFRVWIRPTTPTGQAWVLYTASSEVALRELGRIGQPMPSQMSFTTQISHWHWVPSMDSLATARYLRAASVELSPYGGQGVAADRTFKTR